MKINKSNARNDGASVFSVTNSTRLVHNIKLVKHFEFHNSKAIYSPQFMMRLSYKSYS